MPWTYRLDTYRTLWAELIRRYDVGLQGVSAMQARWVSVAPLVNPQRGGDVARDLATQHDEAKWWHDANIDYFQSVSDKSLPPDTLPPTHSLGW